MKTKSKVAAVFLLLVAFVVVFLRLAHDHTAPVSSTNESKNPAVPQSFYSMNVNHMETKMNVKPTKTSMVVTHPKVEMIVTQPQAGSNAMLGMNK